MKVDPEAQEKERNVLQLNESQSKEGDLTHKKIISQRNTYRHKALEVRGNSRKNYNFFLLLLQLHSKKCTLLLRGCFTKQRRSLARSQGEQFLRKQFLVRNPVFFFLGGGGSLEDSALQEEVSHWGLGFESLRPCLTPNFILCFAHVVHSVSSPFPAPAALLVACCYALLVMTSQLSGIISSNNYNLIIS